MTLGATLLVVGLFVRFFGARLGHLPGRSAHRRFGLHSDRHVPGHLALLTVVLNVLGRIFWR
jgi:hypothetical protein